MNDLKGIIEDCNKSDLVSDKVIKKIIEIIGQEKWQDLYDEESDICTTMGELIITLKDIPYLEEENSRLKEELKEYKNGNFVQTVNQIIEGKDKRLEQAKTFLKEFCAYRMYDCDATRKDYETFEELKKQAEQFLKE